ncbi:DUF2785 domain-containing protein [Streptomyces cocklensis]|uniref:DUF2785 domain-containing protein n=1 Tax=Actinacidiphila cocklensis TaxID=887465 RepID=A0A9W4DYN2_9ACTN|nr:DUF2785 domain-containing protein [Actinacidiphila cocklensis]MDD1056724.1 DUF2785 domain-containing protein [Actinacidiphila cocklensis]WSX77881.1 DUF2785 domain-containing protein [Streptomyces sp. NBC_00899]CAG6397801.1 conserved hypothetical protein [Actinacidiphila cocklensis]
MRRGVVDWTAVAAGDFAFPAGVAAQRIGDELAEMLVSPDPVVRDEHAYTAAAAWIRAGHLDGVLAAMGDTAAGRFTHPDVQARTFAPLVLKCVLARGRQVPGAVPEAAVRRWYAGFAAWYPHERDTRGWDDELGWLHAVAHGADAAAAFAAALPDRSTDLLELCALRMTARDTGYRYVQVEDARLAAAVTRILLAPGLTEGQATGWLDTVTAAFADSGPGAVPAWAFNTFATLQSLHLHLTRGLSDGGIPPHAAAVTARTLEILRLPYHWLG